MYHFMYTMAKIHIVEEKKTGQIKYKLNLPKKIMESWVIQKGDQLELVSFMGDTLTFKLKRG